MNAIRTRTHLRKADIVIVRFAGEYREWNAALDAGYAMAKGTPLHRDPRSRAHARAQGSRRRRAGGRETPEQALEILKYVIAQP